MRKQGDKKAIKNIVQRNLRSEKRRNIMLVISIALASFLICFSGLIATSLMEVQKKQIQDTYEAVYMNVSEEKLLKLKEETGYSSENLEWILTIRTTVAFCDERIEVFVARNLIPGEQSLDEDEFVDVKAYELDELKQMIFEGKIQDSKTMAAILAYESKYLHG